MDLFITPIAHVRSARPTNCVVNALVLATPISGPALVKNIKLDQSNEVDKHKKISIEQSRLISKTRLEKKMTQAQLANLINEKKEIINKYECGQAIIDPKIINKINRALKINIKKKT